MTDAASLADRVREGDLRLHELEAHADADTAAEARRLLVESQSGASLDAVGNYGFPAEAAESAIENMVGAIQVPMGVAGPVSIDGGSVAGEKYLPLATTEGALLASVNRGCSVINSAGGATARVLKSGMTRAPVFRVADVAEAEALVSWTRDNFAALKEAAEETTNHGELLDVTPYVVGNSVYLRFRYDTKDAMGMNMATIATEAACGVVEDETAASLVALSGNLCSDKKPAAINAVEGRGRSVTADVRIPREVVEERLHTTPEAVAELNTRKNLVGSAKAASLGFNAHVANVVAAMFLATGQDEAQVVEGSNAITTAEVQDGDLYVSVSIASLEVGTVGGGTKLPTQSEGLDILGVSGGGDPAGSNADALAECIAVGSLAGELSLLSALASRHLSSAHAELGR
ncbi:hydroxymethylglutaryl-CoA reductase (NADPH) [Haloferax volcanii]|uniref:3-hydroxy-3-methylglutaryl coenzyme A reductase n=3 Tax=Haloferax volcanii TaxID=2246 RepID=A0A6C0UYG7_HALVO|nr:MULTISPECIES: hydroxymethylglutaryl-CoA reductase (NADPH) [Haloferax]ELZ76828.1 3-hydroxy-3-methylglutaryl-CoA reductase [Haloferax lucentense DSM 14919]ELZ86797.1 3-hydroxy-3-methylglutaryl-CoA reductase [Haloferax alexandrinus JCM 10717]NLV04194.1 hydroxymethylglutaryl-CoA reductase (NADPH) [Haloferax alexandrinus]QIB79633.1 hydroxymethylglutaryl-CoA reductase (NADPH) [Haloferax alexandrinus]TVT95957.1 hydroxymethylglutaryl-CoA reductase (NADPH) [Haloferax volcanii]